jgi:hypothetical protein
VRVDHVDPLASDGPPETRDQERVAREALDPRSGRPRRRDGAVGHEVDGVAARPDAVGQMPDEHLRSAQVGERPREHERDPHHASGST